MEKKTRLVEVSSAALKALVEGKDVIAALEGKIDDLKAQLSLANSRIDEVKGVMDLTKKRRTEIRDLAEQLVRSLQNAEWASCDWDD